MQNTDNLAKLRNKAKLSFEDVADILHVSLSSYKYYEYGTVPMTLEQINILSNFYDVSFDYLLGISKIPNRNHFRKSIDNRFLHFSLRYLRRMARATQKEFAKELEFSISSVSKYEKNDSNVTLLYLIKIVNKFHISSDYICGKSLSKIIL